MNISGSNKIVWFCFRKRKLLKFYARLLKFNVTFCCPGKCYGTFHGRGVCVEASKQVGLLKWPIIWIWAKARKWDPCLVRYSRDWQFTSQGLNIHNRFKVKLEAISIYSNSCLPSSFESTIFDHESDTDVLLIKLLWPR